MTPLFRLPHRWIRNPDEKLNVGFVQDNFEAVEDGVNTAIALASLTGAMTAYGGSTAPSGFLLCDGTAVSRTTYIGLFTVLSTTYGAGDGSTTFNLPDLRGRVPVGVDGAAGRIAANDALGQSSGAATHTLNVGQLPNHTHSILLGWTAGANFRAQAGAALADFGTTGTIYNTLETDGSAPSGGNGQAHNNLQPYQVVNWIIKT